MSTLILSPNPSAGDALPSIPKGKLFVCFNGPCQSATVDAPYDTTPGNACAIPWTGPKGKRFAVYVVVEHRGTMGLMYLKSYDLAFKAEQRVREISAICAAGVSE